MVVRDRAQKSQQRMLRNKSELVSIADNLNDLVGGVHRRTRERRVAQCGDARHFKGPTKCRNGRVEGHVERAVE
jgi:hypothetical protein